MFNPGDRIRYRGANPYFKVFDFAMVIDYKGSLSLPVSYVSVRFDGYDYRIDCHPNNCHQLPYNEFVLDSPISPFEQSVHDYIKSELTP